MNNPTTSNDQGILYGISLGPGAPDLLSLRAVKTIGQCDVIFAPSPKGDGNSLALDIARPFLPKNIPIKLFHLPMVKGLTPNKQAYQEVCTQIKPHLWNGQRVGVLCEGDAMFYGSFQYIVHILQEFTIEIIPGISSVQAAGAFLHYSLGSRNAPFMTIPATLAEDEIRPLMAKPGVKVFIKIGNHFHKIYSLIKEYGYLNQSCLMTNVSMTDEDALPLAVCDPFLKAPYFSLIFVCG